MTLDLEIEKTFAEILTHLKTNDGENDCKNWSVGVTYDPGTKGKQINRNPDLKFFKCWDMNHKETAKSLERYLLNKGFNKAIREFTFKSALEGHREDSTFLYVYMEL
jgi:hypothetical protein